MNKVRFLTICLFANGLSACTGNFDQNLMRNEPAQYTMAWRNSQYYSQSYADMAWNGNVDYGSQANVPENYYVGPYHSPTSHKDSDRNWVNGQNPRGYTIELGESDKASQIAKKLFQAPKKDRMAEIKAYRNGATYYKGVYGSYNNYDEAQKALNNLPNDVKQGAAIKNWGEVQGE